MSFTHGTYTEESWWCIFQSKSFFSFWVYQVYYWSFLRVTAIFYAWYRSLGVSLVQGRLILTARKSKWTQWMAAWKLIVKKKLFNNNTKYQKVYFFLKYLWYLWLNSLIAEWWIKYKLDQSLRVSFINHKILIRQKQAFTKQLPRVYVGIDFIF